MAVARNKTILLLACFVAITSGSRHGPVVLPTDDGSPRAPIVSAICGICANRMDHALDLYANGTSFETIINATIDLCLELNVITEDVCEGLVHSVEPDLQYIIDNTPGVDGDEICGSYLMALGCETNNPDRDWMIELPNTTKPAIDEPPFSDPPATLKILHLADTHYDPLYMPGSSANCEDKIFCCRSSSGMPEVPEDAAGYYGDYRNCDSPKWLLELLYQDIATNHQDIDFIIWTGDLVPHIVWDTSREDILEIIHESADLIRQYFPNTPVYPTLGNHEGNPVNTFPQPYVDDPEFDVSWLYDEIAVAWGPWLPAETEDSIRYSGSYTAVIREGLRMISINTNYCYGYNWYLIHDDYDIGDLLQNLAMELQSAEDDGDFVYIAGHIPSGSRDCSHSWSREFNKIVSRYEDTITGIFYGHTHNDHYHIYFDPEDSERPYEVAYIAQSQTPYSFMNPGYKIYTVEGDYEDSRYRVVDHDNYIMDLELANSVVNDTTFYRLYSAKEEYGLPDLSPQSWYDLVLEMNATGSVKFDKFYRNLVKGGTPSLERGCDEACKTSNLCQLLVSDNSDRSKCDIL